MRDHEIAAMVNDLRDAAIRCRDAQQLRAVISNIIAPAIRAAYAAGMTRAAEIAAYSDDLSDALSAIRAETTKGAE
jgi:hypothetical protein